MKIGFIGYGNMNSAIIKGILNNRFINEENIYISNPHLDKLNELKENYNVNVTTNNNEVIINSDLVVLGIKPQIFETVLTSLESELTTKQPILVSIAAGLDIQMLQQLTNNTCPIIRLMPNLNAQINESVSAITRDHKVCDDDFNYAIELFKNIGEVYEVKEDLFPIFTGLAGCSIAFNLMYLNALALAGVKNGLSKDIALNIAIQAVKGTAENLKQNKKHPLAMLDEVCSPGGTTIAGVFSLEDDAFQASVIKAVEATMKRDNELKK